MQRIGFQASLEYFRATFLRAAPASDRSTKDQQHQDRRGARLNVHAAKEQPVKRLINDVERRQRQQPVSMNPEKFSNCRGRKVLLIRRLVDRRTERT